MCREQIAGCSNVVGVIGSDAGRASSLLASRFAVTAAAAASSYVFCKRSTNVLDGWMEDELIGGHGHGAAQVCPSVFAAACVSVTWGLE